MKRRMNDASTEFILFTKEQQELYRNKLLQVKDFNNAFELVKMAVEARFKIHRAGIRYYRGYQLALVLIIFLVLT